MTSVIMIAPLNAANFESGNATDGQVLTADGAGGASWEAAGGGGASPRIVYAGRLSMAYTTQDLDAAFLTAAGRASIPGDIVRYAVPENGAILFELMRYRVESSQITEFPWTAEIVIAEY